MPSDRTGLRFIVNAAMRKDADFRKFAEMASVLKPFGEVLVNVAMLAEKASHEIPAGGSPWHEYAVANPALHKVFPHPAIAPFVPAKFVEKNQKALKSRVAILKKLGLGAAFLGQEPYYLPEAFFQKHPHLRGPRIDHPRRTLGEEFAICTDHPEGREITAWMMRELKKNVPMLEAFMFNTNDAGSGFCWAAALYPGPNGPQHCRTKTAGRRVREYLELLHEAAKSGGGDVTVLIGHANFWSNERNEVLALLPPNSELSGDDSSTLGLGSMTGENYPVRGLVNPLGLLEGVERLRKEKIRNALMVFEATYHRVSENFETIGKVFEIVTDALAEPTDGLHGRLEKLHAIAECWGGRKRADELFEALVELDRCVTMKNALAPRFRPIYTTTSMRHLTRPLVIKPDLLTPEEEDYWLPHVFNPSLKTARADYIDLHGGRMAMGSGDAHGNPALLGMLAKLRSIASTLEGMKDAPEGEWLFHLATSIRVYAAITRSSYNFFYGQLFRDRHAAELSGERRYPDDFIAIGGLAPQTEEWNALMRDEMDNITELIALFEERGLDQFGTVDDPKLADTFAFGPDIVEQLKKKASIMREHWMDVEHYLAPPMK